MKIIEKKPMGVLVELRDADITILRNAMEFVCSPKTGAREFESQIGCTAAEALDVREQINKIYKKPNY